MGSTISHGLDVDQLTAAEQAELLKISERLAPATGKLAGGHTTPVESLVDHFIKHGSEVKATTIEQYLNKATQFSTQLQGATTSPVAGPTAGVIRYKKNGLYIDLAPDGSIASFEN